MDIIIGGGITGLSYALFKGDCDYQILEKENEIGGYCRTIKRNNYIWDYSGHFFHFSDRNIERIITSHIEPDEIRNIIKKTSIKYGKEVIDFPFQKNIHQLPKDEFIDCLVDLFMLPENPQYETFKEMLYCKFGKSISEKFLIPYNEKLYACDLNLLDKDAMGRFFPYAQKEEIIRNFKKQEYTSYNATFLYPINGAAEYIKSLAKHINIDNIQCNKSVVKILPEEKMVLLNNGTKVKYDRIISTIPFPKLLQIVGIEYDEKIYSWNKVLVFNLGFDKKGPERDNHWIYYPNKEYSFYRVGFYDNILNENKTSLYVELGFSKDEIINPHEHIGRVLKELIKAGCTTEDMTLVDYESIIMDPAYVHISASSNEDVQSKKKQLAQMDIYSIGRYGSWTYCSIEDNVKEAQSLARLLNSNS